LPMRRKVAALTGTLLVAGLMSMFMPAANAQVGYPPGPCVPGNITIDAGAHAIGTTFSVRLQPLCAWDPGSPVTLTVDGTDVPGKIADAGGGVTVTVTVLSATQLSIDDPVLVASQCGANQMTGSGRSSAAAGAIDTATAKFRVICPAAAGAAQAGAVSGVAFTGANILKWAGIALVMIVGGWLLVGIARRRRANPTA
jgi:hypothetical protein